MKTDIEWTDRTWNPTTGCNKVSAGCKNCYAEVMSKRLKAMGHPKYKNGFELTLHPQTLRDPYEWKSPKMVFVNSMSDLFHPDIPLDFIKQVFRTMNNTPHVYQILTKRPEGALAMAGRVKWTPNIWMGTSVENEKVAHRIADLVKIPARVRFLSCEPLLGSLGKVQLRNIHWVIVGGESGHSARQMKEEWVQEIYNICYERDVPFFFKQWGKDKFNPDQADPTKVKRHEWHAKGGCLLNGFIYRGFPLKQGTFNANKRIRWEE